MYIRCEFAFQANASTHLFVRALLAALFVDLHAIFPACSVDLREDVYETISPVWRL